MGKVNLQGDGKSQSPEMGKSELPYINRLHQEITQKIKSVNQSVRDRNDGLTDGEQTQENKPCNNVISELKTKYMLNDEDLRICIGKMKGRKIRSPVNFLEKTIKNYIREKSVMNAVNKMQTRNNFAFIAPKNYFNGYNQRTYDVDELEKKLLAHSRGEEKQERRYEEPETKANREKYHEFFENYEEILKNFRKDIDRQADKGDMKNDG
jgi:hypothetical protein